MKKIFTLLFTLGLGLGIGGTLVHLVHPENAIARPEPQSVGEYNPQLSLAPLVEALSPAVVNIDIQVAVQLPEMPLLSPFGYNGGEQMQTGQGSGFLISEDGYLLTNYHVVEGADTLKVKLSNEKIYEGKVVGYDDSIDIALVKIEAKESLPFVALGSSEAMKVGDWVVAIGNPFGLSHTVTTGIISAKGRVIGSGPYDDFIQTDASINPGNSGGPLFNLNGEVIGINTAINPRAQGIGFSVPIDKVSSIIEDLKKKGRSDRGWLGVGLKPLSDELAKRYTLDGGAIVGQVYNGTPAQKAGLTAEDIILKFGEYTVDDTQALIRVVGNYRAGESVEVQILRNGKPLNLSVTLGQRPTEKELARGTFLEGSNEPDNLSDYGIKVAEINGFDERNLMRKGLVVLQLSKTSLLRSKLRSGDIIVEVNGSSTASRIDLVKALASARNTVQITYFRNGSRKKTIISF